MASLKKRITVVFGVGKYRRYGDFCDKVVKVKADIGTYILIFVTPSPTVAAVNTDYDTLGTAQEMVLQRKPDGVATRNAAYTVVLDDMRAWIRYVQALIDGEPDPEQQMIIASASGFDIKVNGRYIKPQLRAVQLPTPGSVKLIAQSAGISAAYEFQMSANNGTTWTAMPVRNVANITINGLTVGTRYVFRVRSTVKNVLSGWTAPVSFIYTITL